MKKSILFAVGIFSLILAITFWYRWSINTGIAPSAVKSDEPPIPTQSKNFALEKQPQPQAVELPTPASEIDLSKDFYKKSQAAAELRIFVETVKSKPKSGGALYAFDALQQCKILRTQLPPAKMEYIRNSIQSQPDIHTVRRLAAIDWLEKRCNGFTDSELSIAEQNFLVSWGVEKDPLFNLRRRIIKRDRSQSPEALLSEILNLQDPLLLAAVPTLSAFGNIPTSKGEAIPYLDGEKFGGLDFESYMYAWNLAICAIADTCDIQNEQLQLPCAIMGECANSIPDHIRQTLGSEERFGQIILVSNRLQQVIRARNVQALLPKKNG